ncbi:MAG: PAS domain S-box protein, partial [Bacteroidales bacterium]|nr:PAS domain S-box protein [Bacteroidales bacterium]
MKELRLLIAEDLPEDAEMAQRELKNEGIEFIARVVDNKRDFKKEIILFKPHLVISDYSMPAFDGMEALKITKKVSENIPLIIFTGSMNEETAVECMEAGATDYVIKEQVRRLPFAVREAIEHSKTKAEKEKFENQLIESERKFRDLFFNHLAVKLIIDPRTLEIVEANKAAAEFYGWSIKQLHRMKISDINLLEEEVVKKISESALKCKKKHHKLKHRLANGSIKTVDVFSSRVMISGKEFLHSIIHDISDLDRAENIRRFLYEVSQLSANNLNLGDYLKAIHEKLQSIVKADNFYVAIYNRKTDTYTFPYHADQYEDFTSNKPVSLKDTLTDYVRKTEQPQLITEERERELNKKQVLKMVGKPSPVWIGAPLVDASKNELIGVIALQDYKNKNAYSMQDLGTLQVIANNIGTFIERIRYLEKLKQSELNYKYLFEKNPHPMWVYDLKTLAFLAVNNTAVNKYGYSEEEFLKMKLPDIRPKEERERLLSNVENETDLIQTSGPWYHKLKDSKIIDVEIHSHGLNFMGHRARLVIAHDITERRKFENALMKAKEKAEENDKLKSAFLANMSHEIRTPMNGILGFLDLIQDPELSREEMNAYKDVIRKSGDRLLNTISDIIEISRIESGEISVEEEQVDINERIRYFFDFFKPEAERNNLQFKLNNQLQDQNIQIKTDQSKLDSILTNFIKNALKFTEKGYVEIGCKIESGDLVFYVKDTGPGIPEEKKENIFDRFVQADTSHTRPYEGSGLGLSISTAYAEMLGGEIAINSEFRKGSTFI